MRNKCLAAVLLTTFLTTIRVLAAEDTMANELPTEPFNLRLSAFFATNIDTTLRVDTRLHAAAGEWNRGTTIDLADQLNMDTSVEVFRGEGSWNMTKHQRLDFEWFDLRETGETTLADLIDFGDTEFGKGVAVHSYLRTNIFRLSYTYFLIQKPRMQLGVSLGVHVMKVTTGISAVDQSKAETSDITAPMPVLGLNFTYALTSKWLLRAHGEYFTISYDKYEGELVDLYGAIEYRMSPHWSLGGGYEYFHVSVLQNNDRYRMDLQHDWIGYQAYLSYRF